MIAPRSFLTDETGSASAFGVSLALVALLSAMFLKPLPEHQTTLEDGLGPKVLVQRL